jgi:hypothetical protein
MQEYTTFSYPPSRGEHYMHTLVEVDVSNT